MKKFRRLACGVLAATMALATFAGCGQTSVIDGGGSGSSGTKTKIMVMNTGGGIGRVWLDEAIKRFTELKKDESYEDGKTGVTFEVEHNMDTGVETMKTAGYHVYFNNTSPAATTMAADGRVLNINDIVTQKDSTGTSIEDRIDPSYRSLLKANDGNYYVLPHFAHNPQISYDVARFESDNLFFAAPDTATEDKEWFESDYGNRYFADTKGNPNAKKSCGNDGIYGTYDDGLPTSLVEMIIICAKMKEQGISPMHISGKSIGYNYMLIDALWSSLGGYEEASARYTYNGKVTVVDGTPTSEDAFSGIDYIKKVPTKTVNVIEGTGYLANDSAARYYALAFMEILEEEGWFSTYSYQGNNTHVEAMWDFISNGRNGIDKLGMYIEGDYWYNEARDNGKISTFKKLTPGVEIKIGMMPLPTSVFESVTPGNGRELCNLATTASMFSFINANIAKNAGLVRACKEFLQFCYSQEELDYFTAYTGVARSGFRVGDIQQKDVPDDMYVGGSYYAKSKITLWTAENVRNVYANKSEKYNDLIYTPTIKGVKSSSPLQAMRDKGATAWDVFNATRTSASGWGVTNP